MRNVLFVFCEAKQRTSFPAYSTVHSSHLHEKWAILTKEPSFKKLVKRFLKYRLYIKHHFRYLPTTQSVAIKYMTDGLAFPVLTVFPGIAKKTPTTSFQLYSLLRRLWSFEEGPRRAPLEKAPALAETKCMVFFQISRQRLLEGPFSSVYSLSEKI